MIERNPYCSDSELSLGSRWQESGRVSYGIVTETIGAADDGDIIDFLGAATDVRRMISMLTLPVAREYANL